ncbi:helix-turn-helix domain-containing protein [Virgibacillus dakarensis]|uniref:helix-turn-helix domain-containing protein n=1 Tax=Virgibacillus dakarensis TaxID=1917889 RepID=UPI000B4459A8|nr:AraC family transcriptional regulator [Virgibacillus dakarensis]
MTNTNDQINAVIKAIEYMKKHIDKEITSEELAGFVGYSPYHFSRVFKEVTGVSPRYYLSALRIETGKEILVNASSSSVLKAILAVGFRSFGTFSTRFKQFVGLSPKQFQISTNHLHQFINQYQYRDKCAQKLMNPPFITIHLEVPVDFKGIIFVGLFPRPIPDQKPVIGKALMSNQTNCVLSKIPPGTYYALAAAFPISLNPKDYFLLDRALRGKFENPIEVTSDTREELQIKLRQPLPFDPPILVNLPKLLFDQEKNKAN